MYGDRVLHSGSVQRSLLMTALVAEDPVPSWRCSVAPQYVGAHILLHELGARAR